MARKAATRSTSKAPAKTTKAKTKPQPTKTKKVVKKAIKAPTRSTKKDVVKAEPKAKPAVREKKAKEPYCPKGYTPAEYEKFKSEKKRLENLGNNELKEMLAKNLQSRTGNKDQLILKIADGIVLGRIPRCPKCYGGRPKFDSKAGTYYCPGYRDDVDFKNCHSKFTKEDLKRDPWE